MSQALHKGQMMLLHPWDFIYNRTSEDLMGSVICVCIFLPDKAKRVLKTGNKALLPRSGWLHKCSGLPCRANLCARMPFLQCMAIQAL